MTLTRLTKYDLPWRRMLIIFAVVTCLAILFVYFAAVPLNLMDLGQLKDGRDPDAEFAFPIIIGVKAGAFATISCLVWYAFQIQLTPAELTSGETALSRHYSLHLFSTVPTEKPKWICGRLFVTERRVVFKTLPGQRRHYRLELALTEINAVGPHQRKEFIVCIQQYDGDFQLFRMGSLRDGSVLSARIMKAKAKNREN